MINPSSPTRTGRLGTVARGAVVGAFAFFVMAGTMGTFLPVWLGGPAFAAAGALAAGAGFARGGPLLAGGLLFLTLDLPAGQWFHWGVGVLVGLVAAPPDAAPGAQPRGNP